MVSTRNRTENKIIYSVGFGRRKMKFNEIVVLRKGSDAMSVRPNSIFVLSFHRYRNVRCVYLSTVADVDRPLLGFGYIFQLLLLFYFYYIDYVHKEHIQSMIYVVCMRRKIEHIPLSVSFTLFINLSVGAAPSVNRAQNRTTTVRQFHLYF